MYIDADVIIKAGAVVSALSVIVGVIVCIVKQYTGIKKQLESLEAIQKELTDRQQRQSEELRILCKATKGTLEGLIERGCNGPCKNALQMLEDYLNDSAHNNE